MSGKNVARPRIGINAHLLSAETGYRRAGIHQYIAQVLRHLPSASEAGLEYLVFTRHPGQLADRGDLSLLRTRWPTERRLVRILWEQTAWPWQTARRKLDLIHSMAFVTPLLTSCPSVVTVYDLSFVQHPERYPKLQREYLFHQTARSCRAARRVITISQSARQDVHRFFQIPLQRIDVVQPGVDSVYMPLPPEAVDEFRRRKGLPERFILHVGTLQPRKNISLLLEALALAAGAEWQLVLVGGKGWFYDSIFERVQALGLGERVRFTGYVPDEELPFWYNAAALLAFPSVYEGFGMPLLEAMACGTPVVAASGSSIPEAGGDAALYFDVHDAEALAERITAVFNDPRLFATMREKGLARARRFSWARAGQETALVYHRALEGMS